MRLDNDLIRQIMLKLEKEGVNFNPKTAPKLEYKEPVWYQDNSPSGDEIMFYHLKQLVGGGFLSEKQLVIGSDGEHLSIGLDIITNKGHEYIDSIRDDKLWAKIRDVANNIPLEAIKDLAIIVASNKDF